MAQVVARIVVAQAGNPAPGGYTDGSRDGIAVGDLVTLTNADNSAAKVHRWTISPYYPAGTLAGLSATGDGADTCQLTPDVAGDISVTLTVQGDPLPDGRPNVATQTITLGIRAEFAGYDDGLPLPHPLEGGKGTSAAVDKTVGNAGRVAEAIYALSQGSPGGGSGVTSIAVDREPELTGDVVFAPGDNVALVQVGNTITVSATGGGGTACRASDANDKIVVRFNDAAGTTTIAHSGSGTAFSITESGAGSTTLGVPVPTGSGALIHGVSSWQASSGAGLTYHASATNLTVEARFQFVTSIAPGAGTAFLCGKLEGTDSTFALLVDLSNGKLAYKIKTASGFTQRTVDLVLERWAWYHVAITYDGANVRAYINGVEFDSTAQTGALAWDDTKPYFFGNPGTSGIGFELCDVFISDVARSASFIADAYSIGAFGGVAPLNATRIQDNPVDATPPVTGDTLVFDGTTWVPTATVGSPVQYNMAKYAAGRAAGTVHAADYEIGVEFTVLEPMTFAGADFYWASTSGTPTVNVTLWDDAGSALATSSFVSSTTPTVHTVTFGNVDLTAHVGRKLVISAHQTTGSESYYSNLVNPGVNSTLGPSVVFRRGVYDGGAGWPQSTLTAASEYPGVSPILVTDGDAARFAASIDANAIRSNNVAAGALTTGQAYRFDGADLVGVDMPGRVIAGGTVAAGYTLSGSFGVTSIAAHNYGSGTNSMKITLSTGHADCVPAFTPSPDWVSAYRIIARAIRISATEIRVDFHNLVDTQIDATNAVGHFSVIAP